MKKLTKKTVRQTVKAAAKKAAGKKPAKKAAVKKVAAKAEKVEKVPSKKVAAHVVAATGIERVSLAQVSEGLSKELAGFPPAYNITHSVMNTTGKDLSFLWGAWWGVRGDTAKHLAVQPNKPNKGPLKGKKVGLSMNGHRHPDLFTKTSTGYFRPHPEGFNVGLSFPVAKAMGVKEA